LSGYEKVFIVSGSSGLLGNKIVEKATCHFRVIPLHNTKPLHAHSLKLDITNASEVSRLFNKFKPYAVIHMRANGILSTNCVYRLRRAFIFLYR